MYPLKSVFPAAATPTVQLCFHRPSSLCSHRTVQIQAKFHPKMVLPPRVSLRMQSPHGRPSLLCVDFCGLGCTNSFLGLGAVPKACSPPLPLPALCSVPEMQHLCSGSCCGVLNHSTQGRVRARRYQCRVAAAQTQRLKTT